MDSSRRAVEAYWRSRMIDVVTSDEDKVAPVYKLEEICQLLRTSHAGIVKEVSEYIQKRLDHKSPVVKQKALRLIKYAVGKSGVEFRREMQRHSVAMRQLFHYKGQMDDLKGDALNKAVRDTAREAVSAMFASEEKPVSSNDTNRKMQGFGNTNFETSTEDKKSFLDEVVGIGSATIRHGLSTLTAASSLIKNDSGSYRSPALRRSLTTEKDSFHKYDMEECQEGTWGSSVGSKGLIRTWSSESLEATQSSDETSQRKTIGKGPEERLLDTIVTSGGVRLQPTRDAVEAFLKEAVKVDAISLCLALESKLQSHVWQVRVKAACILEAILRRKDEEWFCMVATYFTENRDAVVKCSEIPQASVREKANKVLGLLDGDPKSARPPSNDKDVATVVPLPDLIDAADLDSNGTEDASQVQNDRSPAKPTSASTTIDDLFRDGLNTGLSSSTIQTEGDLFADVSFHTNEIDSREQTNDLFSGLVVDDKHNDHNKSKNNNGMDALDIFADCFALPTDSSAHENALHEKMAGLSVRDTVMEHQAHGVLGGAFPEAMTTGPDSLQGHTGQNDVLSSLLNSQTSGKTQSAPLPSIPVPYNFPANVMYNQAFASQQINYGAVSNLIAQQQLLATMSNFQHFGGLGNHGNLRYNNVGKDVGYTSKLPDIFQYQGGPIQSRTMVTEGPKKEETRAFDFISDHISAARDPKRIV